MVIFHSYVKLPEGIESNDFYLPIVRSKLLGLAETSGSSATTATAASGSPAALGGTIHQIGARMVSEGKYILSGFDLVQGVKNWGDFGVKMSQVKTKKGAWTSLLISFLLVGG